MRAERAIAPMRWKSPLPLSTNHGYFPQWRRNLGGRIQAHHHMDIRRPCRFNSAYRFSSFLPVSPHSVGRFHRKQRDRILLLENPGLIYPGRRLRIIGSRARAVSCFGESTNTFTITKPAGAGSFPAPESAASAAAVSTWNPSAVPGVQSVAGPDQEVEEFAPVALNGLNSVGRIENEITSYQWRQVDGPPVTLTDPHSAETEFTAPEVGGRGASLSFELTVASVGGKLSKDTCIVNVIGNIPPPTADAGPEQTAFPAEIVGLDGFRIHGRGWWRAPLCMETSFRPSGQPERSGIDAADLCRIVRGRIWRIARFRADRFRPGGIAIQGHMHCKRRFAEGAAESQCRPRSDRTARCMGRAGWDRFGR